MGAAEVDAVAEETVEMVVGEARQLRTPPTPTLTSPAIRVQNIRIYPQASGQGALYIINSDEGHISVLSLLHARGRMYSRHAHKTNETGASPSTDLLT